MTHRPSPSRLALIRDNARHVRYFGLARDDVPALLAEIDALLAEAERTHESYQTQIAVDNDEAWDGSLAWRVRIAEARGIVLLSALAEACDGWDALAETEGHVPSAIPRLRALLAPPVAIEVERDVDGKIVSVTPIAERFAHPTDARADLGLHPDTPVAGQFEIDAKDVNVRAVAPGAAEGERRRLGTWTAGDWVDLCAANRDAGTVAPGAAHAPSVTPDGGDVKCECEGHQVCKWCDP